jgi:hypothetical protein
MPGQKRYLPSHYPKLRPSAPAILLDGGRLFERRTLVTRENLLARPAQVQIDYRRRFIIKDQQRFGAFSIGGLFHFDGDFSEGSACDLNVSRECGALSEGGGTVRFHALIFTLVILRGQIITKVKFSHSS